MENVVIDPTFWSGRRVFLTGHTGFKGAWTCLILRHLGAEVFGFALPPQSERALFVSGHVADEITHRIGDVRNLDAVRDALGDARPSIVLHMAAQALVRQSYAEPVETYSTNVMGTVNVLEAIRHVSGIDSVVIVTSDKCYQNTGSMWAYRETDPMGGYDPYSNSKGCAELVTSAFRQSFFAEKACPKVASGRAGNVIGGGDWARDRLVPDAMRAFIEDRPLAVRNPNAIRPWQHVLDPVCAYLVLAERLARPNSKLEGGWNFGPPEASAVPVRRVADSLALRWGTSARWQQDGGDHPHEASFLSLDCTKASLHLGWRPLFSLEEALELTVDWYKAFATGQDMWTVTREQIKKVFDERLRHHPARGN
jgi:CDP-glucose 4,6-dehydratase